MSYSEDEISVGPVSSPTLVLEDFPSWKIRMVNFLENFHPRITECLYNLPFVPMEVIPRIPATCSTPAIPERFVPKSITSWSQDDKEMVKLESICKKMLLESIPQCLVEDLWNSHSSMNIWADLDFLVQKKLSEQKKVESISQASCQAVLDLVTDESSDEDESEKDCSTELNQFCGIANLSRDASEESTSSSDNHPQEEAISEEDCTCEEYKVKLSFYEKEIARLTKEKEKCFRLLKKAQNDLLKDKKVSKARIGKLKSEVSCLRRSNHKRSARCKKNHTQEKKEGTASETSATNSSGSEGMIQKERNAFTEACPPSHSVPKIKTSFTWQQKERWPLLVTFSESWKSQRVYNQKVMQSDKHRGVRGKSERQKFTSLRPQIIRKEVQTLYHPADRGGSTWKWVPKVTSV